MTATDNPAEVGLHVFERAKLGKAPFRCIGVFENMWTSGDGSVTKPGGSCDYCGNGIRWEFCIRDSHNRRFKVGSDCVMRTGDAGLIRSYKNRPEVRAMNKMKRKALDERKVEEWKALLAIEANREKLASFTVEKWDKTREPWLTMAERVWPMCGAAGRARYLKAAKNLLATAPCTI